MAGRQSVALFFFFLSLTRSVFFDARLTGYSPLDFTVADPHWGTIDEWVQFVDTLHARGMYLILDFTVGTMSDLIGFKG